MMGSVLEIACRDDGAPDAVGTGFVICRDGPRVLTAAHLVAYETAGGTRAYGSISGTAAGGGEEHGLELVLFDKDADLALLRFKEDVRMSPLELADGRPSYGEKVIVPGNALGYGISLKEGIVSVPGIEIKVKGSLRDCVMISIALNRGDSGAPIVGEDGHVVGMASFGLREEGRSLNGIGFGISSACIMRFLGDADAHAGTLAYARHAEAVAGNRPSAPAESFCRPG